VNKNNSSFLCQFSSVLHFFQRSKGEQQIFRVFVFIIINDLSSTLAVLFDPVDFQDYIQNVKTSGATFLVRQPSNAIEVQTVNDYVKEFKDVFTYYQPLS